MISSVNGAFPLNRNPPATYVGAGESVGFYINRDLPGNAVSINPVDVAKFVVDSMPTTKDVLMFRVAFNQAGKHISDGYIYMNKKYGVVNISLLDGSKNIITITNGEYSIIK